MHEYLWYEEVRKDGSIPDYVLEYRASDFKKRRQNPTFVVEYRKVRNPRKIKQEQGQREAWMKERKLEQSIVQLGSEIDCYRPPSQDHHATSRHSSTSYDPKKMPAIAPAPVHFPPIPQHPYNNPKSYPHPHPHGQRRPYQYPQTAQQAAINGQVPRYYPSGVIPPVTSATNLIHGLPHNNLSPPQATHDQLQTAHHSYVPANTIHCTHHQPSTISVSATPSQYYANQSQTAYRVDSPLTPSRARRSNGAGWLAPHPDQTNISNPPPAKRQRPMPTQSAGGPINTKPPTRPGEGYQPYDPLLRKYEYVPEVIEHMVKVISELPKSPRTNLPLRKMLMQPYLGFCFDVRTGIMRKESPLYQYYGDTRLFSYEEWKYLAGGEAPKMCHALL